MGKRLFVGNLSFSTTDAELRELFAAAGPVDSAQILMDRATGRSRGFGFVEMSTDDEAQRAISEVNGREFQDRAITVNEAREKSDRGPRLSSGYAPAGYDPGTSVPRFLKDGGSRRGI